jgi:hypothetical protein
MTSSLLQAATARPYELNYTFDQQKPMLFYKSCYEDVLAVQQTVQSLTGGTAAHAVAAYC